MVQSEVERYKGQIKETIDKLQGLLTEMDETEYFESDTLVEDPPALDVDDSVAQDWCDILADCSDHIIVTGAAVSDHCE